MLQAIAVSPSSEQNILNSGVFKDIKLWKLNCACFSLKLFIILCSQLKDRLFKASIVQDDKCFFCKENPETLLHLLFHCLLTVAFWNDFRERWPRNTQIELNVTPAKVLNGVINNLRLCRVLNFALLVAKFYIIISLQSR